MSHYNCKECGQQWDSILCICDYSTPEFIRKGEQMVRSVQGVPPAPARVIGYDPSVFKQFTCSKCAAIVEYRPVNESYTGNTDEGTRIKGLKCPGCGEFHRTNP